MKKAAGISVLLIGLLCLVFFAGLFIGRASMPTVPDVTRNSVVVNNDPQLPANAERININTADMAQLQQLPGVGEVLAQRIIDYRTANGPFKSLLHLQEVDGIGQKTLENIAELICLEDQP